MKTRYILTVALAVVAFTGCQKENVDSNRLQLIAEGMGSSGAKLAVNNEKSYWVADENVRINGVEGKVVVNPNEDGSAYVNKSDVVSAPYCGVYPASIYSSNSTTTYTLNLPDSYQYATTTFNGKTMQNLASPMVAYAASGSTLTFKHVTSAIGVQIVNYHYDYDIVVDQVQVISNKYRLHGEAEVDLTADDLGLTPETGSTAAERTVTMTFDGGATLVIPRGGSAAIVQVPVLPVDSDNKFTVSITVHRSDNALITATLSREQASANSLGRAKIGYAMYTLGGPFSVSASKKVIFSKGNLQYNANSTNAGTAPYTPAWRFAPNQYDYIGSGNNNIAENYYGWIDLFGWGTGDTPTKHTTLTMDYSSYSEWGTAATASLGSGWYTLSKDEWVFLTTGGRTTQTAGLPSASKSNAAKFVKAVVNSTSGVIIFPDNYTHPSDVNITQNITEYNATGSSFTQYTVTSGWDKMVLAGAIFVPAGGYRSGISVTNSGTQGYYWESTTYNSTYSYMLNFSSYGFNAQNNYTGYTHYGCSVRLVKDID